MLRRALTAALAVALVALSGPITSFAKAPALAGSIVGRAIDASGTAVGSQRVELVQTGNVVNVVMTGSLGDWSFTNVWPGEYVVRMTVRGKVAGVRVSVGAGQTVGGTLIVVPTAMVSPQLGTLASLLTIVPSAATAVAATTAAQAVETETTDLDATILTQILNQLPAEERLSFVTQVIQAVQQNTQNTGGGPPPAPAALPFAQYVEQFTQIQQNPTATVQPLPPAVPVSG